MQRSSRNWVSPCLNVLVVGAGVSGLVLGKLLLAAEEPRCAAAASRRGQKAT